MPSSHVAFAIKNLIYTVYRYTLKVAKRRQNWENKLWILTLLWNPLLKRHTSSITNTIIKRIYKGVICFQWWNVNIFSIIGKVRGEYLEFSKWRSHFLTRMSMLKQLSLAVHQSTFNQSLREVLLSVTVINYSAFPPPNINWTVIYNNLMTALTTPKIHRPILISLFVVFPPQMALFHLSIKLLILKVF